MNGRTLTTPKSSDGTYQKRFIKLKESQVPVADLTGNICGLIFNKKINERTSVIQLLFQTYDWQFDERNVCVEWESGIMNTINAKCKTSMPELTRVPIYLTSLSCFYLPTSDEQN